MKRSEYGTTSFVFLNIINSSAPAIKKKLPLIRIGYYAKGETMVPPLSLPLIENSREAGTGFGRLYFGGTHETCFLTSHASRFYLTTLCTIPTTDNAINYEYDSVVWRRALRLIKK